jgi:hypothetical protein
MKRFFLTLSAILLFNFAQAQLHEIGVFLGGSNVVGDIGSTRYVNPNEVAYGIVYKWNLHPRYSWRFSYTQSKVTGDDANATDAARKVRGLRYQNNVKEIAAGFEFNFNDFDLNTFDKKITPYVFTGVSYIMYEGLFFPTDRARFDSTHGTVGIPMTLGVKTNFLRNFVIGAEVGARYTFADDIDGSNPTNKNIEQLRFGNINSNEWIMFTGFTLTYTFGSRPCYCAR